MHTKKFRIDLKFESAGMDRLPNLASLMHNLDIAGMRASAARVYPGCTTTVELLDEQDMAQATPEGVPHLVIVISNRCASFRCSDGRTGAEPTLLGDAATLALKILAQFPGCTSEVLDDR